MRMERRKRGFRWTRGANAFSTAAPSAAEAPHSVQGPGAAVKTGQKRPLYPIDNLSAFALLMATQRFDTPSR